MTKFFKKKKNKKTNLGAILDPTFLWKRAQSVFKYSNYLTICKKSEKTNDPFLKKMPNLQTRQTNGQMDRWTKGVL